MICLLSGGLDSSYNFYRALQIGPVRLALTFDYGQKAASSEVRVAAELCHEARVPHQVVKLPFFSEFTKTSLVSQAAPIPQGEELDITSLATSQASAARVWVPNRNGIMLNVAAGFAEGLGVKQIVVGFNAEEALTFPDNTGEFIAAANQALSYSTANGVEVVCFSTQMQKVDIVRDASRLGLPLARLWPCYFSGDSRCGSCESCLRFARAIELAGVEI